MTPEEKLEKTNQRRDSQTVDLLTKVKENLDSFNDLVFEDSIAASVWLNLMYSGAQKLSNTEIRVIVSNELVDIGDDIKGWTYTQADISMHEKDGKTTFSGGQTLLGITGTHYVLTNGLLYFSANGPSPKTVQENLEQSKERTIANINAVQSKFSKN